MIKYCSYIRVSTTKQGESEYGLNDQRETIAHFAKDGIIVKEFLEIKSAKTLSERPILNEAIEFCLANDYILVTARLDRLSRDVENARWVFEKMNYKLRCCDLPPNVNKMMLTIMASIAEYQREYISFTTKQGLKQAKMKHGEWRMRKTVLTVSEDGKFIPIGLTGAQAMKDKSKNNPNNIRASQMIRRLRNEGKNLTETAKILNESSFKTANGKEFSAMQVSRLAS